MTTSRPFRIFGIEIERKTDIMALAAFFIGLSSIFYQAYSMFIGSDLRIMPTRQIILYTYEMPDTEDKHISIISTMDYINIGQPGHNDAVIKEYIQFYLVGEQKRRTFDWHKFVRFTENKDVIGAGRTVGAFVVNAGSAEAHETWFTARNDDELVTAETFKKKFEAALTGEVIEWEVRLFADTLGARKPLVTRCAVQLSARRMQQLLLEKGWVALDCLHSVE